MHKKYMRLTLKEREEISRGIWANECFADIARRINRPASAISREVWGNVKYSWCYRAEKAQHRADENKKKGRRPKKLDTNPKLKNYVYEKLRLKWSPEEIANRIKTDYSQDKNMRASHETIYKHIYCLPRGELKAELMKGLRQERKMRQPRKYAHYKKQRIQDIISISERPKEAEKRIVPGHWEGDLLMGKERKSAIGTLVERTTRLTLLVPLKEKDSFAVRNAFAMTFKKIPSQFKKTLTYDRGSEMSQHKLFTKNTKIQVYFADPHSPWQRGTNENTNGLIRQYFPKGTDFRNVPASAVKETERRLNSRPRKVLNYRTPSEKFYELVTGQKIALET
ncbi:MAG: IS30 family transposase [Candidatus Tagabacteria bacterium CG_4_10_14_0_2_um_filter_40_13]|nr:MAG: IS30 family transposase [Candidatus Tagabacteria bacterium CG_4_10_14_0_2_um_filter_40_13]